jgi:hypothetical protein
MPDKTEKPHHRQDQPPQRPDQPLKEISKTQDAAKDKADTK